MNIKRIKALLCAHIKSFFRILPIDLDAEIAYFKSAKLNKMSDIFLRKAPKNYITRYDEV